jgi:hypothetical protein
MRFFVSAIEVLNAARELEAAEDLPGGYIFDAEPVDIPVPVKRKPIYRCKYHDIDDCFACQYQSDPMKGNRA